MFFGILLAALLLFKSARIFGVFGQAGGVILTLTALIYALRSILDQAGIAFETFATVVGCILLLGMLGYAIYSATDRKR